MKRSWIRLMFVACVLALMVAGLAIEARHSHPEDVFKCQPCTATCDPSQYTTGYCTEGKWGQGVGAITYACCCCNGDAKNRYFHGG